MPGRELVVWKEQQRSRRPGRDWATEKRNLSSLGPVWFCSDLRTRYTGWSDCDWDTNVRTRGITQPELHPVRSLCPLSSWRLVVPLPSRAWLVLGCVASMYFLPRIVSPRLQSPPFLYSSPPKRNQTYVERSFQTNGTHILLRFIQTVAFDECIIENNTFCFEKPVKISIGMGRSSRT